MIIYNSLSIVDVSVHNILFSLRSQRIQLKARFSDYSELARKEKEV